MIKPLRARVRNITSLREAQRRRNPEFSEQGEKMKGNSFYEKMGASATKEEVHAAIKNQDKGIFPNAFVKVLQDQSDKDTALIIHADGAGTKSLLAYLYYKETGDASYYKNSSQDSAVMNLDDMACAGAVNNIIMSNTIDRNTARIGGDAIKQIIEGYSDFTNTLAKHGVNVLNGGGETADVGDVVSTAVINSTCFARLKKSDVISFDKVSAGDVIVGLSSSGKAVYETKENSGIGSNGLTAARHALLKKDYAIKYPEICCSTLKDSGYNGKYAITDKLPNSTMTVGEALISPSRTYVPVINKLLKETPEIIHGIVHNTGGGLVKSANFGKSLHYIKDNLFETPAIFKAIQESGKMEQKEMFKVFNMGHRMEIYAKAENAAKIIAAAEEYNIEAKIIGRIEKSVIKTGKLFFKKESDGPNKVTISHKGAIFTY